MGAVTVVRAPGTSGAVSSILALEGLNDTVVRDFEDGGSAGHEIVEGRVIVPDEEEVLEWREVDFPPHIIGEQHVREEGGQTNFDGHVVTPNWVCRSRRLRALANVMMI